MGHLLTSAVIVGSEVVFEWATDTHILTHSVTHSIHRYSAVFVCLRFPQLHKKNTRRDIHVKLDGNMHTVLCDALKNICVPILQLNIMFFIEIM